MFEPCNAPVGRPTSVLQMPTKSAPNATRAADNGAAPDAASTRTPAELLQRRADALYRAAAECHRQRQRYACLVQHRAPEGEQNVALRLARLCDEYLVERIGLYDKAAAHCGAAKCGFADSPWWHKANAVWRASREYERRHQEADRGSRTSGEHTAVTLGALTLDYDLEASALLFLKHALDDYRACRPEAELGSRPASA